jgi:hypothetical protein
MAPTSRDNVRRSPDEAQFTRATTLKRRPRRYVVAPGYAMVPDIAEHTWYIWDQHVDAWHGPYATRMDAELALLHHRARRSPLVDALPRPARCAA